MGASATSQASCAPMVSVVVPTFNRLRFLRAAIESVYTQTFIDWELIIADDGSDLETREYLQSLATQPRVSVVWLRHTGKPAMVRNAALQRAVGRYVAFLDSDDLWAPRKLERQLETLRARSAAASSATVSACQPVIQSLAAPGTAQPGSGAHCVGRADADRSR